MSAWNAPAPPYNAPSTTYMNTFTPYLQLKHLLSLTWLAYPVLSLLIVAFRLQLSLATSQDAVTGAKNDLLASCKAAETAATTAASLPRYLAIASNQQFSDAVNGSLNAARAALILALTVMEAIINFIVDLYRSTFLCFLELVVRGGLAILISAVQEINSLVQSAAASLRTSIQSDISSANSAITTAINAINKINPFSDIQAPQISVPSLDSLQNLTLPDSFTQALTNLNNSIPSVADLKDVVESIIDTPFELVKKDINDTFSQFSFDSSVLPIPDQNRLSFCNQLDTSLVDDVGRDLIKTTKIGIIIMILLALLLIGLNCLLTWYKWRCMKAHFEYTRQAWATDPTITHTITIGTPQVTLTDHNLMLLQSNSAHPLITRIVNQIAARFRLTPSQYTNLQWFLSYIFHAPAVACLLIGFFGLLSIQIQLLAMGPLVAKYQDRAQAASSDFSNSIAASINSSMYNQSAAYASNINGQVDAVQTQINNGVFGWIENTTQTLNNTVNAFYDDVQNAVATVFNGSILEEPANEFIKCFIGSKVDAIESALTFLHDNLQIDIPRVNDSVLVLSPASVNEATAPIAAAALGDGSDGNQGILLRLVNGYAESLKRERILFALFLGLWGFVVLMAICILMFHSFKERKRIRYLNESRTRHDEIVVPYKIGMQNSEEKGVGQMGSRNLPAFTPLPSPKFNAFKPFSFSRSPSPASTSSNDPSQSKESLPQKPESSWANLFTRNHNTEGKDSSSLAKGPTRLFAIGRKAIGKDRVKTTVEEQTNQDTSSPAEPQQNENRNTAWFKRMTNVISKKDSVPDFWENNAGRGRPNLQISIEPPSRDSIDADDSVAVDNREDEDPKSRWSASPDPTQNASPWANMITPVKKPFSPPRQPISLPMRPKPRHNASVPTSISIDTDPVPDLMVPMQPTPFARPLHHGFDSTQHAPYRPPPPPSHPRPPRPLRSPRRASLAPPPDRHRRSSTVPEWTIPQTLQVPVSRFLTGQTSPINPFVTPFDDERHVTIDPPAHARKSMRTNPFAPVAL